MPTRRHRSVDTTSLKRQLMSKGKRLKHELEMADKRAQALALRQEGKNYEEIGRAMGISGQSARKYVLDELVNRREAGGEDLESVRDLEVQRLDAILETYWPKMRKGDKFATSLVMQVMERRSAYLGLDAPKRTEFIGAVASLDVDQAKTMTDDDLRKRALQITQRVLGVTVTPEGQKP